MPSTRALAAQTGILQTIVLGLAVLAAYGAGLEVNWLSEISLLTVTAAAAVLGAALALALLEARRPLGPDERLRSELRKTSATDPVWLGVTLYAGFVEEFAYRGALTLLLAGFTDYWVAATVSAVLFGLGHLAGGWRAVSGSALFALAFQGLVILSGGLLLAVIVHIAYDLAAAWLGRRLAMAQSAPDT